MRRFTAIFLGLFALVGSQTLSAQCAAGELQLDIAFTTDNFGYESYWELSDGVTLLASGGNPIAIDGTAQNAANTDPGAYGNGQTINESICVQNPSSLTLTLFDDYGDGGLTAALSLNGIPFETVNSTGSSLAYNFNVPLPNIDAGVIGVTPGVTGKVGKGEHFVEMTIKNNGLTDITSLTLNWAVGAGKVRVDELTGLSIPAGATYHHTHSLGLDATTPGMIDFRAFISEVNGSADENSANDEFAETLEIFENGKVTLVELWTNAGCPPCALYVPPLTKNVREGGSYAVMVAFHSDWPGTDVMNQHNPDDPEFRGDFYNISSSTTGYPTAVINGNGKSGNPAGFTAADILGGAEEVSDIRINNPTVEIQGGDIVFSAEVEAYAPTANLTAHMAVVEKDVQFPSAPGSNGETEFGFVMKKMVPDYNGTAIAAMSVGAKEMISGSWTLSNVYENEELAVVFYVQDDFTEEVLQTTWADLRGTPDVSEPQDPNTSVFELEGGSISLFPNPTTDFVQLELNMETSNDLVIDMFDMTGKQVRSTSMANLTAGTNNVRVNVQDLNPGLYVVNIQIGENTVSERILVQ